MANLLIKKVALLKTITVNKIISSNLANLALLTILKRSNQLNIHQTLSPLITNLSIFSIFNNPIIIITFYRRISIKSKIKLISMN